MNDFMIIPQWRLFKVKCQLINFRLFQLINSIPVDLICDLIKINEKLK